MDDPGDGQTVETLKQWALKAKENGFTHVFFLTSDKRWKELQVEDEASLFYVPSVPLATVDEAFKHTIMEDQLKGLMVDDDSRLAEGIITSIASHIVDNVSAVFY